MDTIDAQDLARWCSGEWEGGMPGEIFGLTNDTRTLERGQLFAALRTERRDGHAFLDAAKAAGASGAIVERYQSGVGLPQLVVKDVGEALLAGARGYRLTWQPQVVGITGSCGKTTCKEILRCLLSSRWTVSTVGNLNNLIGVPMSILRADAKLMEFAVLEAGISEPGEMGKLAEAIDPDWAIVSAIGPAHLKGLGDVRTIAREKGGLARGKRVRGVFLGETCLPYLDMLNLRKAQLVKRDRHLSVEWAYRFESEGGRTRLQQRIGGSAQSFEYEGTGAGLASNVAVCLGLAFTMGIEVDELRAGLAKWKPQSMRNEWRRVGRRLVFLDCYNANPVSMRDALETFEANTPSDAARIYLIGCMEELGDRSAALHRELGRELPIRNEDFLLVIGSEAKSVLQGMKDAGRSPDRCREIEALAEARELLASGDASVFLKGSRRYRLEDALAYIDSEAAEEGEPC